ncbi:hypothetical protein [Janthinobacterium sp. SUN033]|uniref:hypothetical protein n=1 Tax=Janthinobacterium sp. SUN033 TaxID=3002439 RepID=UPI0025B24276|nr:hypothetical protein [Janthinobacterium sp. SUN033]MDN2675908.1 hypothetical protein [Janthinobacterium sp. SUN033]
MSLTVEKYYPFFLSAVAGCLWWYFSLLLPVDEKEFLAAALSLGAVLTGFIATAQAILMALPSDSAMGRIRATGYLPHLTNYIGTALYGGMVFCAVDLAGFFLLDNTKRLPVWFSVVWAIIGIFAALSFFRVTSIMLKIMRHP